MALQDPRQPAQQKSLVANFPPPVGGWNTRDALPMMQPTDAIFASNVLCQPWQVVTRLGSIAWTTGTANPVTTLAPFNSATSGSRKTFGAQGTGIYDMTTAGPVGAPVVTGLTNSWWQWVNFGTQAGQFLVMVNGADQMRTYNGAAWTATATLVSTRASDGGTVATSTFINVSAYENTLYYVPINTLGFYYQQQPQSIFGTVNFFNLGALATRGGFLQAIAVWTVDGGNGPQDYLVCITSEGEYIVYQGLSFSITAGTAGAMTLVGVYYIARPLGRRCWSKFGGDCLVLTERGLFPLSQALQSATIDKRTALTDKIEPTFVALAVQTSANNWQGWQIEIVQSQQFLIITVPTQPEQQLVMQFQSKGWSNWSGWDTDCVLYTNGTLYFGGDDGTFQGYVGGSDSVGGVATAIQATIMPAFSALKQPVQQKHVKLIRPYFVVNGNLPSYIAGSAVDFNPYSITQTLEPGLAGSSTMVWGTSLWGNAQWGSSYTATRLWHTLLQYPCFAFAPYWQFTDTAGAKALTAYDILYAAGGVM